MDGFLVRYVLGRQPTGQVDDDGECGALQPTMPGGDDFWNQGHPDDVGAQSFERTDLGRGFKAGPGRCQVDPVVQRYFSNALYRSR